MNRIKQLLTSKKNILSIYFTAGYPRLEDTIPILQTLEKAGVDLVEIGMPFSDPLADGSTIQASSLQALKNGMSLKVLFKQLEGIRQKVSIPIILMGYYNTVHKYGLENFIESCASVGVDGTILPDLPFNEYITNQAPIFDAKGISNVFLITPQTNDERIRLIDQHSSSFIYMVSSAAVTGTQKEVSKNQTAYFDRVNALQLKSPTLIGFGIGDYNTFSKACEHANGAIVGSAFIKLLEKHGANPNEISRFIQAFRSKK